jgi:hypothetical protein
MKTMLPVALLLLLLVTNPSQGASTPGDLKGINSVNVVIEEINDDAKHDGLDRENLQTQVELHLRMAGLQVNTASPCFLYVNACTLKESEYSYYINVNFNEIATIRTHLMYVNTWEDGRIGVAPASELNDEVTKVVLNEVDTFANEWLRDNPKSTTKN